MADMALVSSVRARTLSYGRSRIAAGCARRRRAVARRSRTGAGCSPHTLLPEAHGPRPAFRHRAPGDSAAAATRISNWSPYRIRFRDARGRRRGRRFSAVSASLPRGGTDSSAESPRRHRKRYRRSLGALRDRRRRRSTSARSRKIARHRRDQLTQPPLLSASERVDSRVEPVQRSLERGSLRFESVQRSLERGHLRFEPAERSLERVDSSSWPIPEPLQPAAPAAGRAEEILRSAWRLCAPPGRIRP